MLAHLIQREQALFLDRLDDHALAHAVAAAHLHGVGHLCGIVLPLVASVAEVRLPEHQMVADLGHVLFVAQHLEIPAAVHGVAHHHAADDAVILQHDFFVHAADGVVHELALGIDGPLGALNAALGVDVKTVFFRPGGGGQDDIGPVRACVAMGAHVDDEGGRFRQIDLVGGHQEEQVCPALGRQLRRALAALAGDEAEIEAADA